MKKRLLFAVLLLLGVCTVLSGCHGSKSMKAFEAPEKFDTGTPVEIVFWAKNDTNMTQKKIYQQAIKDFETLYPNVTVTLRSYTNYNDIYRDVINNISTGTTPNLCITYPDHIATYKTGAEVVVPLEQLMDHPAYGLGGSDLLFDGPSRGEMVEKFLNEGKIDGVQYALPFLRSTEACYINKTYVEAMGFEVPEILTWDYIWEVSEAAMEKNPDGTFRVNGQQVMIPFIYKSTDNMMITMLKQKNGEYSTEEGEVRLFNETTEDLLLEIASHGKTGAFSTFGIESYPGNYFNAGQCIFAIDSTAGATWIGSYAPLIEIDRSEMREFETAVRTVPQYDTAHPQMISQGPSMCIFNKSNPQEVVASWLFMQYLLTNEVQIAYSGTEGYLPVTSKAFDSAEYKNYLSKRDEKDEKYYSVKIDASKLLLDNIENSFVTPVFNGSASVRSAAGQLVEKVTRAARNGETVSEAEIPGVFQSVGSLYRLDQIQTSSDGNRELGELPAGAKVLLGVLAGVWVCIGVYFVIDRIQTKKQLQS